MIVRVRPPVFWPLDLDDVARAAADGPQSFVFYLGGKWAYMFGLDKTDQIIDNEEFENEIDLAQVDIDIDLSEPDFEGLEESAFGEMQSEDGAIEIETEDLGVG